MKTLQRLDGTIAEYNNDGSLTPNYAESWSANADASEYINVVKALWNNGDDFTAEDVARNIEMGVIKRLKVTQWCQQGADRPDTGVPRARSLLLIHNGLKRAVSDITIIAGSGRLPKSDSITAILLKQLFQLSGYRTTLSNRLELVRGCR